MSYIQELELTDSVEIKTFKSELPTNEMLLSAFEEFLKQIKKDGVVSLENVKSDIEIGALLRASIISYQFGHEYWYREMIDLDPMILKASEVLRSEMIYSEQLQ